jgi:hypothetical protein
MTDKEPTPINGFFAKHKQCNSKHQKNFYLNLCQIIEQALNLPKGKAPRYLLLTVRSLIFGFSDSFLWQDFIVCISPKEENQQQNFTAHDEKNNHRCTMLQIGIVFIQYFV